MKFNLGGMRMKNLTRILALALSMVWMISSIAFADPVDWTNKKFNFHGANRILVHELDTDEANISSSVLARKFNDTFMTVAEKTNLLILDKENVSQRVNREAIIEGQDLEKLTISDPEEGHFLYNSLLPKVVDLYVVAGLEKYSMKYIHHDAYITWETVEHKTSEFIDDRWEERTWIEHIPKEHPAWDEPYFIIKMHYEVYDAYGNLVFEREDVRERSTDDAQGMVKRSFESFWNEMKKKTK